MELKEKVEWIKTEIPDWTIKKEKEFLERLKVTNFEDDIKTFVENNDTDEILKEIDIYDTVEHYGESRLLDTMNTSDVVDHYFASELLSEMDKSDVLDYYDIDEDDEDNNKDDIRNMETEDLKHVLHEFCRNISPRRCLDKETIREIVNEFIDGNYFNIY